VSLCQSEPRLVLKQAYSHDVVAASHEQLAAHDNGGKLEEQEAQGQQRLQEGAEKPNNVVICSCVWKHEARNCKFKWEIVLEQP